jgi:methylase of polypeptide subunit release factors
MSERSIDIEVDAAKIADEIRQAAQESITEEDLRVRVEKILREVCEPLGIPWARYERTTVVRGLRSDALYGNVILEYENPDAFKTKGGFDRAVEQLKNYIEEEAERAKAPLNRFFGVALDGFKIGFVRYSVRFKDWNVEKPVVVNSYSVLKLLEAIRGLARKPLDADLLIKDFGPGSKVAKDAVKVFYKRIMDAQTHRSRMLFNDWRRVFSQVCAYSPEKIKGLEEVYGIPKDKIDYEALLFAVHTYYALVMKLLAAEVAVLFGGFFLKSYAKKLESAYIKSTELLQSELKELEEGGIFVNLGIENFLEADYFAWYLDEWDDEVANAVVGVVKKLSEYEPGTAELEPDVIRDLFKRLYQNLVPKKIRHDLGEYYTPDWLAELLLNEAGFTVENFEKLVKEKGVEAPLDLRLLDPACGSGTFLVLAVKRVKEYAIEHFLEEKALGKIVKNIVGFDLNPLAVLASRANYLLALGELIRVATVRVELPVYFADSILAERKSTYAGIEYALKTIVGTFSVPVAVVEKGILGKALSLIEECVHHSYSQREFKERATREFSVLSENEVLELANLFVQMLKLEKAGKNKIWTRVLKNSFAPLFVGKFDFVVGNPPWINWESLPEDYRNATISLWEKYGLKARATAKQFELGKMRRDISMVFVYACADRYLEKDGFLGFLITQMVFKTKGAEVFRRFNLPDGSMPLKVLKVHDMITLKPFEGAANMTSMIILQKGKHNKYPVPYILWEKEERCDATNITLDEAFKLCSQKELVAVPIDDKDRTSTWLTAIPSAVSLFGKVTGTSAYKAYAGVYTGGANGVYWVKIMKKSADELIIENLYDCGKKKLPMEIGSIEKDLIHGLIRSGDTKKWNPQLQYYVILPHTEQTDWHAISESKMKVDFPKTYSYFTKFKQILLQRSAYTLLRKGHPFYIMVDIHKHSFAPYKVAWKRMGSEIEAAVLSPTSDPYIGKKPLIPQETISFISLENQEEAHYLCAILNSTEVNALVKSFSQLGGKSFATPSILEQIKIPKFDAKNKVHVKLAELSKEAHELAIKDDEKALTKIENEIDALVAEFYGLSSKELQSLKEQKEINPE